MADQFCPHCMHHLSKAQNFCPDCGMDINMEAPPHHLPIGTVLRNRGKHAFLFGVVKGEGGFGLTYIGRELSSDRLVAIKEYYPFRCQPQRLPDGSVQPQERFQDIYAHGMQSFLSEASMLQAVCDIPSIVHVLDYFEANGTAYMVMEYLNGSTLYHIMQTQEQISSEILLPKFLPLMRDLSSLHTAGVLHRDIAPDNIMWMPDDTLKLLDFGCARSLEDGRSMTVVLKPGFAPIEQYQTRGQGPYTDIYALCATIYYCLTGKVPPASPERLTATFDNQQDPLIPPSATGISILPEQEQCLMWGLSLQPSTRPQKIADLAARLEKASAPPRKQAAQSPENPAIQPDPAAVGNMTANPDPATVGNMAVNPVVSYNDYQTEANNTPPEQLRSFLSEHKLVVGIIAAVLLLILLGLLIGA
ncbi:MAG: protein kinase [Blautia sp.]|nr:protein kinase [Blautia sp.]